MIMLVIATTGEPRHELLSFLRAVPSLNLLSPQIDEGLPDLVVLDASEPSPDDAALLRRLRTRMPTAHSIALVSSPRQMAEMREAGADRVLLAGFSAAEFFQALDDLFN